MEQRQQRANSIFSALSPVSVEAQALTGSRVGQTLSAPGAARWLSAVFSGLHFRVSDPRFRAEACSTMPVCPCPSACVPRPARRVVTKACERGQVRMASSQTFITHGVTRESSTTPNRSRASLHTCGCMGSTHVLHIGGHQECVGHRR
jgi:hypothetical protein